LSKIKHFLTEKPLEIAVHAFISSYLDYCNSLYCSISKSQIQLIQNVAARFSRKSCKYDHITPRDLHWLPIQSLMRFPFSHDAVYIGSVQQDSRIYHQELLYKWNP